MSNFKKINMNTPQVTKVVCKQLQRYIGWPTLIRISDGRLVTVFSGDREGHVCPFGKTFLTDSRDDGESWSEPQLVNNTPLDDRDTGLCECPDGTLVLTWFASWNSNYMNIFRDNVYAIKSLYALGREEWQAKVDSVSFENIRAWAPHLHMLDGSATKDVGYWCRRSRDGGKTWDTPSRAPVKAPHGALAMPSGDLLYVGNYYIDADPDKYSVGIFLSPDQGLNWKWLADVSAFPEGEYEGEKRKAFLCEPHVVRAPSGKLIAMARDGQKKYEDRFLWQFESIDGGISWSEPVQTKILGFPPYLQTLEDGRLMLSYSARHQPPGHRVAISDDEGQIWVECLCEHAPTDIHPDDIGYPSTARCSDGTFVSVYYQPERADEKPCLMMTRFAL